ARCQRPARSVWPPQDVAVSSACRHDSSTIWTSWMRTDRFMATTTETRFDMRHKSRVMHDGRDRAAARAMLHAIGLSDDDLKKPIVGVAHSWIETMPCNF